MKCVPLSLLRTLNVRTPAGGTTACAWQAQGHLFPEDRDLGDEQTGF